jgi:NTE family protein
MRHALLACTLLALPLHAQEPAATPPRIGLVLSGGGARGTAHVGVLQVLEELRIPVSCVAGTSMGAIVGGLYSYGLTTAQLEQLVTREGLDRGWDHLLRDGGTFGDLSFRRKEEYHTYLTKLRLGVRDGDLRLPKGVVQGQNLETELRMLTLAGHDLRSFDELPLPFRCTAVDLKTGDLVVLDRGNLADAMRASMSLPGIIAPAVIDGRELIDGGIANNVPIDLARAMGAEVLIVVDIGTPVDKESEVADLVGVTSKMVAILTQQNVDRSLQTRGPGDVLIQPDLQDITSADFKCAAEAIAIGRVAAESAAAELRRFSLPPEQYERWRAAHRPPPRPAPTVRSVHVDNGSGLSDTVVQRRLQLEPGKSLDEQQLRTDLEEMFALGDFQRVRFDVRGLRDGAADVAITVEPKGWGASFAAFGLSLRSDLDRTTFQLAALLVLRQLNSLGAEWRNVLEFGERRSVFTEFYQPILPSGFLFVAPHAGVSRDDYRFYTDGVLTSEETVRSTAGGIDVGAELGTPGELRVGYQRRTGDSDVVLASQPVPDREYDDGYYRALLRFDTLDHAHFADRGWYALGEYRVGIEEAGSDDDYQSGRVRGLAAVQLLGATLTPAVEVDTALTGTRPFYSEPTLGGFRRLSGLPADSLRGQHAALATLELRTLLVQSVAPLYVGGTVEVGNVWASRGERFDDQIVAGSVFLAADSPLGPLYLGCGFAEGDEFSAFVYLGPDF